MHAALDELRGGDHARPDPGRMAVMDFGFSGPLATDYAAATAEAGLPVPSALLVYGPDWFSSASDWAAPSPETRALVLVGDYDVGARQGAQDIWEWLAPLPAEQREFVTLSSDDHGEPALLADHIVPLTNGLDVSLDALDWYGTWKLADALMACAFAGDWCEYAFNTPEQRFMGRWSDGVPVAEAIVTDDPG
jgi:hypothetical protein